MGLFSGIERTFGNPDQERMVHAQFPTLKIMMGMREDEYMAKFEMLAGRTSFNKAAFEDAFI